MCAVHRIEDVTEDATEGATEGVVDASLAFVEVLGSRPAPSMALVSTPPGWNMGGRLIGRKG